MKIAYANVYVTNLARSTEFFQSTLGLDLQHADPEFGYASFDAGPIRMGIAQIDPADSEQGKLVGRQTGLGFAVDDLNTHHAHLASRGVVFSMAPSKQPWGGFMAMFEDPDGNVFYLDEITDSLE